jgi:molybdopterin converting factor small subunit
MVEVSVPVGGIPLSVVVRRLKAAYPELAAVLRVSRMVRNDRCLSSLRVRVRPGDELSVHPPYGGG